jgi:hypothetical protein
MDLGDREDKYSSPLAKPEMVQQCGVEDLKGVRTKLNDCKPCTSQTVTTTRAREVAAKH